MNKRGGKRRECDSDKLPEGCSFESIIFHIVEVTLLLTSASKSFLKIAIIVIYYYLLP